MYQHYLHHGQSFNEMLEWDDMQKLFAQTSMILFTEEEAKRWEGGDGLG